jgi:hypothetical protein
MKWMYLTGKLHYQGYLAKTLRDEFCALEHDAGYAHICACFHIQDTKICLQNKHALSTFAKLDIFLWRNSITVYI